MRAASPNHVVAGCQKKDRVRQDGRCSATRKRANQPVSPLSPRKLTPIYAGYMLSSVKDSLAYVSMIILIEA